MSAANLILPPLAAVSREVWWGLLAGSLVLAAGHLASMLSTRWGDRGAGPKGLIFSLLTHAAIVSGVFAVKIEADRRLGETAEAPIEQDRRFQVGLADPRAADAPAPDRDPLPWRDATTPSLRPDRTARTPAADAAPDPAADRVRLDRPGAAALTADRAAPDAAADAPEPAAAAIAAADAPRVAVPEDAAPAETEPTRRRFAGGTDRPDPRPTRVRPERPGTRLAPSLTESRADPDPAINAPGPTPGTEAAAVVAGSSVPVPAPIPAGPQPGVAVEEPVRRRFAPAGGDTGDPRPVRRRPGAPRRNYESLTESRVSPESPGAGPRAVEFAPRPAVPPAPGTPDAYRLRDLTRRAEIARRYGGTAESEEAVDRALAYLARRQSRDGRWDGAAFGAGAGPNDQTLADVDGDRDRLQTGRRSDTGLTGLATLAFLGAGHTRVAGRYAPAVDRAVRFLIDQQTADGSLAGRGNYYAAMYCHGIAAYALAEALALEGDRPDPALAAAVRRAVRFTQARQYADGGWRYSPTGAVGDVSLFGWQCLALKSAENAGVPMPGDTRAKMIEFLRDRSETGPEPGRVLLKPDGGLARYLIVRDRFGDPAARQDHKITATMTAEALFCKQMLGLYRDGPASVEAVAYLRLHPPKLKDWNLYYWYYATLALFQHGGPAWDEWNGQLRDILVEEQLTRGPDAGSWPLRSRQGNYTAFGGRIYGTALATLCLEAYYRFTPAAGGAAAMDGRPGNSDR